ncbi:uncharacterized protein F5147DRAFT_773332 [Suillus discolor]|uniref:Uncharacterized protein n=1 Tax=Suillus discolor TaxID=1912936 RepID=A0A9P7F720_9AGAM|nr:uncharacterized protein F5147DRAFT_773332 [Suillus discolor]KAG2108997.1 hypothetical protein F5147DRAFT_773332 [Suillus discolor]
MSLDKSFTSGTISLWDVLSCNSRFFVRFSTAVTCAGGSILVVDLFIKATGVDASGLPRKYRMTLPISLLQTVTQASFASFLCMAPILMVQDAVLRGENPLPAAKEALSILDGNDNLIHPNQFIQLEKPSKFQFVDPSKGRHKQHQNALKLDRFVYHSFDGPHAGPAVNDRMTVSTSSRAKDKPEVEHPAKRSSEPLVNVDLCCHCHCHAKSHSEAVGAMAVAAAVPTSTVMESDPDLMDFINWPEEH